MPEILYEDNHLLVINKPAGLLAQSDITGDPNVVDLLKNYRKTHENKPGEAFIGLVHRLDRPVSGVMVLAKTSKAAQRLCDGWHTPDFEKRYLAVVSRGLELPGQDWATWNDQISKDERTNTVKAFFNKDFRKNSVVASLEIRTLKTTRQLAEVEIRLGTGRGHQIRVQLASRGLPVAGDTKYGSKTTYPTSSGFGRIALHAHFLKIQHPTLKKNMIFEAPLPSDWPV
ncbi:MAG: RluA family pseudouridine synthase [bacterium]